jgi:hypothetical protein
MHGYEAIARDADMVLAQARADVHDKSFGAHVDAHELASFGANVEKLKAGAASRTNKLHEQVGAGVHVAETCAALAEVCRAVRDEGELHWLADAKSRDESLARAFGWGRVLDASSVSSVEGFAHALLEAAKAHPKEAAKVHLDHHGVRHLEELVTSLEGADVAHVQTKANRHDATTALDSLAHLVVAETAHVRFVAKRVFRGDATKLARYASALPRHTPKHRTRHAPDPATPPAGVNPG